MISTLVRNRGDLNRHIALLQDVQLRQGRRYQAIFKESRPIRSTQQNKLYWLWLTAIAAETGNDQHDLHEYFGTKYLPRREVLRELVRVSTTTLDTKQFTTYLDHIQAEAGDLGIELVNPEDQRFEAFREYYEGIQKK